MEHITKIVKLFIELSQMSGEGSQKAKIELLKENVSPELEYILDVCFNPLVSTHLNKIEQTENNKIVEVSFDCLVDLICKLKNARAVNDKLRQEVNDFIFSTKLGEREADMLSKIFTKNINIGIGRAIINTAFGYELISNNEMMKADDNVEIVREWFKEKKDVLAEEKFDGVRIWALIDKGKPVHFYTYNFQELPMKYMRNIARQLQMISPINNETWFVDGEMIGKDRKSVSGQITKILKGTATEGVDKNFHYHIFDYDNATTLKKGVGILPYRLRKKMLKALFSLAHPELDIPNLHYVRKYKVSNWLQVQRLFDKLVENGSEGLVLKLAEHKYETRRSRNWIKMKEVKECDLRITGVFPGKPGTKRENTIGGFVCISEDKALTVEVGSGFSDKLLEEIAQNPNYYKNKIVSVKYNTKINDKYGRNSLFLPRLSEIRLDKFKADSFNQIK